MSSLYGALHKAECTHECSLHTFDQTILSWGISEEPFPKQSATIIIQSLVPGSSYCSVYRLQSAKSEQQIEKILGEARAEGLETDTGISQKATQRINELRKI